MYNYNHDYDKAYEHGYEEDSDTDHDPNHNYDYAKQMGIHFNQQVPHPFWLKCYFAWQGQFIVWKLLSSSSSHQDAAW